MTSHFFGNPAPWHEKGRRVRTAAPHGFQWRGMGLTGMRRKEPYGAGRRIGKVIPAPYVVPFMHGLSDPPFNLPRDTT